MSTENTINIAKLQTDVAHIKQALEDSKKVHEKSTEENKVDHEKIFKKIDGFIDSAEKRFASKTVEWLVYSLAAIILGGVFYELLETIFK